jgi:hypothetical protein
MAVDDGLNLSVALGGDDGGDAPGSQVVADEVGVVSLVGEQHAGRWAGLVHNGRIALNIGDLPAAQRDRDREAQSVAAEMDLGREATARAAKTLVLIPLFSAPAACWWARTIVESIIWTLSWPAPVSFSATSITSQIPACVQRRNWR